MDVNDLLHVLGLCDMYPGCLHRQDIFSVSAFSKEKIKHMTTIKNDIAFLQKIVFHNEHCRNVITTKRSNYPHPLDISTAIFLCCNFIARQDLVLHFWGCKHAFPLIIKTEQLESPTIYIWPMKILVAKCYDSDGNVTQLPVSEIKMKVVSAIRFGQQSVSKSNILNMIITESGKEHSFFFHRDLEGSTKHLSNICDGMVEACPILKTEDSPCLYLNLRGNSKSHSDQLNFVLSASDIIVLLCNRGEIDDLKTFLHNKMSKRKILLIMFFTDLSVNEEDVLFAEDLEEFCKQRSIDKLIVALKGIMRFDWMNYVVDSILNTKSIHSIKDLMKIAQDNDFYVDLERIRTQTENAKIFTNQILKLYKENQMQLIFPLQGNEALEWSKADMEIYKLKRWNTMENVRVYRDRLEKKKQMSRMKQLDLIKRGKSFITYEFLTHISHISNAENLDPFFTGEEQNEIFLRILKLKLDNATRSNLNKFYKTYTDLLGRMRFDLNSVEIQQKIIDLDMKINNNSLTISNFTREMGQIYETIASQCQKEEYDKYEISKMPSVAVILLLNGYDIELMDGRSSYVPTKWMKEIMYELKRNLGNIRMKVVSVLGVQSSGKSTLLNIMFGSQFAEGSGRCTRGVYLHLVKVSPESREDLNCDYLFVVDTEGLFSLPLESERSDIDIKDRELATFVIGISNVTIINLMGENLSYLKDILPISVHAFLRMDLVGLKPNCVLLHQNVAKRNKHHLLQQTHHLERLLDECTSAACKIEKSVTKRFKDIIKFDITNDVYYFPPLFHNTLDMINPQFSEDAERLRRDIMGKSDATVSLTELTDHIGYVWEAVNRDNFVFEFKNTTEIKARTIIDREICRVQWELRTKLQENFTEFQSEMNNCTTKDAVILIQNNFDEKIHDITSNFNDESCISIVRQIPSTIIGKSILKFQTLVSDSIKKSFKDSVNEFANLFQMQARRKQKELEIIECDSTVLREIDRFLEDNLPPNEKLDWGKVREKSETLFDKWLQGRESHEAMPIGTVFEEDACCCMFLLFPTRHAKINKQLEEKSISDRNLKSFLPDIPLTYWSAKVNHSEKYMAIDIVNNMLDFIQRKLQQIESGDLNYGVGIFKDIVLHLRNHRHFIEGVIYLKPVFEIDLAMASCGELIQRLTTFNHKHNNLKGPCEILIKHHFQFKVREISLRKTDLSELLENLTDLILTELGDYTITNIPQEFAIYLMNENQFLSSKLGLLAYIYQTLIENQDISFVRICLHSFELSARSCLSKLFDSVSGIEYDCTLNPLKCILEDYFDKKASLICTRLTEATMVQKKTSQSSLNECLNFISSSLNNFIPLNSLKEFESDLIEKFEPAIFIRMLIANFKNGSVRKRYLKKVLYRALNTEDYDHLRNETVTKIICPLIGCTEKCPLCGEVCCIGQMNHVGKHRSLMHRPIGINGNCVPSKSKLSSLTCWEALNLPVHDEEQLLAVTQLQENWIVPSDMCVNDNSFWKFIYLQCVTDIAKQYGKDEPDDIPKSWYDLNIKEEVNKLWST